MPHRLLISARDALGLVGRGDIAVFDCSFDLADPERGGSLYRAGHIPSARYLHLDRDLSGTPDGTNGRHPLPDVAELAGKLRRAGLDNGMQVICYDNAGGAFAARLWWLMRWLGHDAVAVLDGGFAAWRAAGGALEKGDAALARVGDFTPSVSVAAKIIEVTAVLRNIEEPSFVVVDARSHERFIGQAQGFDAVVGHIPGARNRPYLDNLEPDGRFKSPVQLAGEFHAVLAGTPPEQIVLQCGSGVTACHNALAMEIAGLRGARLYPGSWSEWTADPNRPVALGI